jgi:hypothetical protein
MGGCCSGAATRACTRTRKGRRSCRQGSRPRAGHTLHLHPRPAARSSLRHVRRVSPAPHRCRLQAASLGLGEEWSRICTAYAAANRALGDIVKASEGRGLVPGRTRGAGRAPGGEPEATQRHSPGCGCARSRVAALPSPLPNPYTSPTPTPGNPQQQGGGRPGAVHGAGAAGRARGGGGGEGSGAPAARVARDALRRRGGPRGAVAALSRAPWPSCRPADLPAPPRLTRVAEQPQRAGPGHARREPQLPLLRGGVHAGRGKGGSFGISETCPGERSYVGRLRVAGARATRGGGVERRARTDDAPLNPRGGWSPLGYGR